MSAETGVVRSFRVGRFMAEVSCQRLTPGAVAHAVVEWSPRPPDFGRDFTAEQRDEYQRLLMGALVEVMA